MDFYNDVKGANVYDLNPGKYENELLISTASLFTQAGFRIANKERYLKAIGDLEAEFKMSNDNPDVTLVCQDDVSDSILKNAMVFIDASATGPAHVYLSMPEDTPKEKLDEIENSMDCLLHKGQDGNLVGYITLDRNHEGPEHEMNLGLNLAPFEAALDKIRELNIDTVKYPFTPEALGILPLFANASNEVIRNNLEECAEVIGEHFKDNIDAFDMSPEFREIALNINSPRKLENEDDDVRLRNGRSMNL